MFNTTFNNISVISWRRFYWWRKPEYPEKTIAVEIENQINNKNMYVYVCNLIQSTDWIYSSKFQCLNLLYIYRHNSNLSVTVFLTAL